MKNVLIISHNAISKTSNNGKTIRSLFSHYDRSKLSQLYFHGYEQPDLTFIKDYFRITDRDIIRTLFMKKHITMDNSQYQAKNLEKRIIFKSKYYSLFLILRDYLWALNSNFYKYLINWVKEQNPQIVFFVAGNSGFSHRISCKLALHMQIPLVVFFTDDYLLHPQANSIFDKFHRKRMHKFYDKTVNSAKLCFGIGDMLCKEYSNYYNKKFYPIMNSVKIKDRSPLEFNERVTISYFGGLHLDRWRQIISFAKILKEIKLVINKTIHLNVYSKEIPKENIMQEFNKWEINFKGFVNGNDMELCMYNSTFLLHVESDNHYYRSLTKLSISTKIPEYLISNRPIIAFGPTEVASIQFLSLNNIGFVISSDQYCKDTVSKLIEIFSNKDNYQKMANNAYSFARENFDNKKISSKFIQLLNSIKG